VIAAVFTEVRKRLSALSEQPHAERDELEIEAKRLRGEIDRLVVALTSGIESPTIASVIGERERHVSEVRARLEVISVAPSVLDLEVAGSRRRPAGAWPSSTASWVATWLRAARLSKRCSRGRCASSRCRQKTAAATRFRERRPLGCFAQPIASPRGFEPLLQP
jgi:hypothetical protein